MDKDGFIKALLDLHAVNSWMDIDGGDMDELYVKFGFVVERPATVEDSKTEMARDLDVQIGDPFRVWSDEAVKFWKDVTCTDTEAK